MLKLVWIIPKTLPATRHCRRYHVCSSNRPLTKHREISGLDLIRWETHVRPGIANDPQEAINNQIGNACDIIVGIFWGRIGTPTPRAGSGTLEELEKAIARWESDNNSVEVMIYFKDDGISPSQSDPDQLRQLASFRASLPERGVLYKQVTGKEFESLLRIDLARAVTNKFGQKAPLRSQPPTSLPFVPPFSDPGSTDIDQDDGIEELLSQSSADLEQAAAIIARINSLTDEATASFVKHNPELEGLKRRDAIDGIAAGLQSFSERLVQETGQLGFYQERAFGALARSILMASEDDALGQNTAAVLLPKIVESAATLTQFSTALHGTRLILSKMPRLTRSLNIAKRNAGNAIDLLLSKLEAALRMHESIEATLTRSSIS